MTTTLTDLTPEPPAPVDLSPTYYRVTDVALRWNMSRRHVQGVIASGALEATRFGRSVRISRDALAKYEAANVLRARASPCSV